MTEEKELIAIIIGQINETIKPLDLVMKYILWKEGGNIDKKEVERDLKQFIEFLNPEIIEGKQEKLIEI